MTNRTKFLIKVLIGVLLILLFLLGIQALTLFGTPKWVAIIYGIICGWYYDEAIIYFYKLFEKTIY